MALNMQNFMMGFILADREKKRMEEKGIEIPKNFTATQGFLFGAIPNPHAASLVLQNEVQKRDSVISPTAQKELDAANKARVDLENEVVDTLAKIKADTDPAKADTYVKEFYDKVRSDSRFAGLKTKLSTSYR